MPDTGVEYCRPNRPPQQLPVAYSPGIRVHRLAGGFLNGAAEGAHILLMGVIHRQMSRRCAPVVLHMDPSDFGILKY